MAKVFFRHGTSKVIVDSNKRVATDSKCCCGPKITSFYPYWGPNWGGGIWVDIHGSQFQNGCIVYFNGYQSGSVIFHDSTFIQAQLPNDGSSINRNDGYVDVQNPSGEGGNLCCFSYEPFVRWALMNGVREFGFAGTVPNNGVATWLIQPIVTPGQPYQGFPFIGNVWYRAYLRDQLPGNFNNSFFMNSYVYFSFQGSGIADWAFDFWAEPSWNSPTLGASPILTWYYNVA